MDEARGIIYRTMDEEDGAYAPERGRTKSASNAGLMDKGRRNTGENRTSALRPKRAGRRGGWYPPIRNEVKRKTPEGLARAKD